MTTVTVYSTHSCMQCRTTKRHLNRLGVPFREVNVDEDQSSRKMVAALGYSTAPVVVVDHGSHRDHWAGLRLDKLNALAEVVS